MKYNIEIKTRGEAALLAAMVALANATFNAGVEQGEDEQVERTLGQFMAMAAGAVEGITSKDHDAISGYAHAAAEAFGWMVYGRAVDEKTDDTERPLCEHCPCQGDTCCWCGHSKSAIIQ